MSEEDQGRGFERVDVWLGPRHLETLEHARLKWGSDKSKAIRAGLELFRKAMGIDEITENS